MQILPSIPTDIDIIFEFYDKAIAFQKANSNQHWLPFERSLIEKEIEEHRQWKIVMEGKIVCIFAITFSDPNIWGERNTVPAIYIHRIVTNPDFRGNNFVGNIVDWAKIYGKQHEKRYVRMDTWGDNLKLKSYYEKFGFSYLGIITPQRVNELPAHYSSITLSLFELPIP
ncbi:MAG: family N-acetyltransferase [Bacteroidetes bacterium]|jgi:ribosomal protein S18 acetylase RimI-like enzyme|nr:family N-acetyltransferase [Bacteroidota bacterium]